MKRRLSPKQERILEFIGQFLDEHQFPPTLRDIQAGCQISSTSVVDYNLRVLDRDGFLNRRPDTARGIELLDSEGQPFSTAPRVQVVGNIAAGSPIPAFSTEEAESSAEFDTAEVSPDLPRRHGQLFGLAVRGTSMIDALIDDGDIVIVKPTRQAETGDMVVAWLKNEEEVTLKKFYPEGHRVRLQPANSQLEPIYCDASNLEIRGKVVAVIRKFA